MRASGAVHLEAARAGSGVVGVFWFDDLATWMKPMPTAGAAAPALAASLRLRTRETPQYPLARDTVRYVGEPVAVVIARSRAEAEDAAELVPVDDEPLAAVVDTEAAAAPEAPRLYRDWEDNIAVHFRHAIGDADAAIEAAISMWCTCSREWIEAIKCSRRSSIHFTG